MKVKILHIAETAKGGVGTYMNIFDIICCDFVSSTFLVPGEHASHLGTGKDVVTFSRKKRNLYSLWRMSRTARKLAKKSEPDIIFCQSTFSLVALFWLRLSGIKAVFVYCPHSWARLRYQDQSTIQGIVSWVEGRLVGLSDLVLNISHNDRRVADLNNYRGRHVVVENAMPDIQDIGSKVKSLALDKSNSQVINLLFVGRFEKQKGIDILLEAFAEAVKVNPLLRLHVVGGAVDGGMDLSQLPKDLVTFHGWVDANEIQEFYTSADLVVMPSRWEGLPMVLIEALRQGCPVMLSDVSGMGSLLEGPSGVVLPELTTEMWVQALGDLSLDELCEMRPVARNLYETRYSAGRFRSEIRQIIDGLLG